VMFTSTQTSRPSKWRWTCTANSQVEVQDDDVDDHYTGGWCAHTTVMLASTQADHWPMRRCWDPTQSVASRSWWLRLSPSSVCCRGRKTTAMGGYEPTVVCLYAVVSELAIFVRFKWAWPIYQSRRIPCALQRKLRISGLHGMMMWTIKCLCILLMWTL
jgi:hypothetical protein